MSIITPQLFKNVRDQFLLSPNGIHGLSHWARVLANGRRLAWRTGANLNVVELFAVFHDCCRENDGRDPNHGLRGAQLASKMRGKWFEISDVEMNQLYVACSLHTDGLTDSDITIQTCWDSDRLDIGRVGTIPNEKYLCTPAAKDTEMLFWAHERAISFWQPDDLDGHFFSVEQLAERSSVIYGGQEPQTSIPPINRTKKSGVVFGEDWATINISSYRWMLENVNNARYKHLISIMDNASELETPSFVPKSNHLKLDIRDYPEWQRKICRGAYPPSLLREMERLLNFGEKWNGQEPVLVHCEMGVSRSTAAALILAFQKLPNNGFEAVGELRSQSAFISPNRFLIQAADHLLGSEGKILQARETMEPPNWGESSFPLRIDLDQLSASSSASSFMGEMRPINPVDSTFPGLEKRTNFDEPMCGRGMLSEFHMPSKAEIESFLEDHQTWLKSGGRKGRIASFVYSSLEGIDFTGSDLRYARFERCDLRNSLFDGAKLDGCYFYGSDLGRASFTHASLIRAKFIGAFLHEADLTGANAEYTNFCYAFMEGVCLEEANMKTAVLTEGRNKDRLNGRT